MSHARIPATVHPTTRQLEWAAGFLEGEGCFLDSRSARVSANQVNPEPVQRLQAYFGGSLRQFTSRKARAHRSQPIWIWAVNGIQGAAVAMTLYPLLSSVRQAAIRKMLGLWRARTRRGKFLKACCKYGHPFTPENTALVTWTKRGKRGIMRRCQTCYHLMWKQQNITLDEYQAMWHQRRKLRS